MTWPKAKGENSFSSSIAHSVIVFYIFLSSPVCSSSPTGPRLLVKAKLADLEENSGQSAVPAIPQATSISPFENKSCGPSLSIIISLVFHRCARMRAGVFHPVKFIGPLLYARLKSKSSLDNRMLHFVFCSCMWNSHFSGRLKVDNLHSFRQGEKKMRHPSHCECRNRPTVAFWHFALKLFHNRNVFLCSKSTAREVQWRWKRISGFIRTCHC